MLAIPHTFLPCPTDKSMWNVTGWWPVIYWAHFGNCVHQSFFKGITSSSELYLYNATTLYLAVTNPNHGKVMLKLKILQNYNALSPVITFNVMAGKASTRIHLSPSAVSFLLQWYQTIISLISKNITKYTLHTNNIDVFEIVHLS